MRIRTKLLILLLALSMIPLLLTTWRGYRTTEGLGHTLAGKTGDAAAANLIDELHRTIHFGGVILSEQRHLVEAWLVAQESALRDALTGPLRDGPTAYFATDFDAGSVPGLAPSRSHSRIRPDGSSVAVAISEEYPVFTLAPGVTPESASGDIARLAGMGEFYRAHRRLAQDRYYWLYASLANGVHLSYPGHGGFPDGYDGRRRSWYEAAVQADTMVWSDPYTDATTGVAMITASRAVRGDGPAVLGVVGIDVTMQSLLDKLLTEELRSDADVFLVAAQQTGEGAGSTTRALPVHAYLSGQRAQSDQSRQIRSIASAEAEFGLLLRDIAARKTGVRRLAFETRDSLWAYSPLVESTLLAIIPYADVEARVSDVRAAVGEETRGALALSAIGTAILLALVIAISLIGAQTVTSRIRRLASAARRLAAGDFESRVPITSGDEIGELGATFNTMAPQLLDRIKAREALSHLERYFSPNLAAELTRNPNLMKLGGERRELTSLFTDLAGFTSVVERTDPSIIVPVLNDYLDGMARIVFEHEGTVDKVIGDAIHALFNAPFNQSDHAARAIRCALAMDTFSEDYRRRVNRDGVALGLTRIGINSGVATVGNFGGEVLFDYTAHGDIINTAARLESLNKYTGTRILVSEQTASKIENFHGRPVGEVVLKGRSVPLLVHEPLAASVSDSACIRDYRDAYARLAAGDADALEIFQALAAEYPDDALVGFHLRRLQAGETGTVIVMQTK